MGTTVYGRDHAARLDQLIGQRARHRDRSETTIVANVLGEGDLLRVLRSGRITIRRLDRVLDRIAAVWPDDLEWPADIPRPVLPEAA